jgi:DNA-binding beta-propeller fold protein YncE
MLFAKILPQKKEQVKAKRQVKIKAKVKEVVFCLFFLTSTLALTCLFSCAPKTEHVELFWPQPPDEPRIKWVGWIRGEKDVVGETGKEWLMRSVVGEGTDVLLARPYSVFASKGRVYVADTGGSKIAIYDIVNKKAHYIGKKAGVGGLNKPIGVAVDGEGNNIYVTDSSQDRVIVYNNNGDYKYTLNKKGQFKQPTGIAINESLGRIYVVDTHKHNVTAMNKNGDMLFEFGKRGSNEGEFNYPNSIYVDRRGLVYVSDTLNFRVQIFDSDGKFVRQIGSIGDTPGRLARPKGVAVDSDGNTYIVDAAFNNVQIFDREGTLLLFFSSIGIGPGKLWLPSGIFIDEKDTIYIADQLNRRIAIFQYLKTGKGKGIGIDEEKIISK